jgi:dipeptide/tripeptide permease
VDLTTDRLQHFLADDTHTLDRCYLPGAAVPGTVDNTGAAPGEWLDDQVGPDPVRRLGQIARPLLGSPESLHVVLSLIPSCKPRRSYQRLTTQELLHSGRKVDAAADSAAITKRKECCMGSRTPFPPVFWVANTIEVLERFAYYGIYMGFGIYMNHLGYSMGQLGIIQSIFLLFSYMIPVISGTFADRFGFKKVLIISYLAYLPSILLLMVTRSFSGIALTMLSIGFAAGIFKPLIAGTVRAVTDSTNKTLGFGIFYAMVNVGASFGPVVAAHMRAISWNHAFVTGAVCIGLMFVVTILFYKEPERDIEGQTLREKFRDIGVALSDLKFTSFLVLIGVFFWLPLWAFFNLLGVYVDTCLDTARLYTAVRSVLGETVANFISDTDEAGVRHILGESISHTGYVIMICQVFVSRVAERFRPIPTFTTGLIFAAAGFILIGWAHPGDAVWVFPGILLFAIGEMACSPRIQEYVTWLAPKDKAGLYMGTNFLSMCIGATLSGVVFTTLFGYFKDQGHAGYVWYVLAATMLSCIAALFVFIAMAGEFKELEE